MTLLVQRLIGVAAIVDPLNGVMYPVGPGFEMPPHKEHRAAYSFVQAQEVVDWLNGNDRPLNIVTRQVDPFDPMFRRNWDAARADGQRRGLAPIRDKE